MQELNDQLGSRSSAVDVGVLVRSWLDSWSGSKGASRNTLAVGMVVLDRLRSQCPIPKEEAVSRRGEIKGARSGLKKVLQKYGIRPQFLKEVTTRQAHQAGQKLLDELDYGRFLEPFSTEQRDDALRGGIDVLVAGAREWLAREHIRVSCPRTLSPASWLKMILDEARGRSGGIVEQQLVGAKLQQRFPSKTIANQPSHAGDAQTKRPGDFVVGKTAYHVTAAPSPGVIEKCQTNVDEGFHPCLLVPARLIEAARALADQAGAEEQITVVGIEEFVGLNVIEMAKGENAEFVSVFGRIIETYNQRLKEAETDMSLRIEIK